MTPTDAVPVSEEQLSDNVLLRTNDLVAREQDASHAQGAVVGFLYELSVGAQRGVLFFIDITGSENLRLESGGFLNKSEVPAGSSNVEVARVRVVDASHPWSLQCRYTWTEKETERKEIAKGVVLETTDMWAKGRAVTAIAYNLKVDSNKRVVFTLDFHGSENLELATGGTKLKTVAEPLATTPVGYLQVINPTLPWSLKCKYEWSEDIPNRPVVDKPELKDLGPGLVLRTVRSDAGNGDTFRYELACSKNAVIDFTLDCSESSNMTLKDGSVEQRTVVQPWDRAHVGTVIVANPTRPWNLKCKFAWSERSPRPPSLGSSTSDTAAAVSDPGVQPGENTACDELSSLESRVASVALDEGASVSSLEVQRASTATISNDDSSFDGGSSLESGHERMLPRASGPIAPPPPAVAPPAAPSAETAPEPSPLPRPTRRAPGLHLEVDSPNSEPAADLERISSQAAVSMGQPGVTERVASTQANAGGGSAKLPPGVAKRENSGRAKALSAQSRTSSGEAAGPAIHLSMPLPPPSPMADDCTDESKMDNKEIGPNIFLTTYQILSSPTRIVYKLDVRKPATVTFAADFTGSANLSLRDADPGAPLSKHTVVAPFTTAVVAHLEVADKTPGKPWNLRCKYAFEEHDDTINAAQTASIAAAQREHEPPPSSTPHPSSANEDQLQLFLRGLSLDEYASAFRAEQVDFPLLLEMAAEEDSLRGTLRELGVAKLGHREKIITALRKHRT